MASRAVDAFDAFEAFHAVYVCCQQQPGCLIVYILGSSCLIMLFGAYFVQKVGFCPFLANLAESESGGAVDASTATNAFAMGAKCVLQPLQTYLWLHLGPLDQISGMFAIFTFVQ